MKGILVSKNNLTIWRSNFFCILWLGKNDTHWYWCLKGFQWNRLYIYSIENREAKENFYLESLMERETMNNLNIQIAMDELQGWSASLNYFFFFSHKFVFFFILIIGNNYILPY